MSLLNLSLPEVLALFGAISAAVVALYLLDRSRRRQVVATLRFWTTAQSAETMKQRKRIQQPWSMLLQLLGAGLLLLAIAQMQWGDQGRGRDHILLLDTSAWMGSRTARGTLMVDARAAALAYLRRVPAADRVMLIRADALTTPATAFESSRAKLEAAVREAMPSAGALNLAGALDYAARVQKLAPGQPGEIAYIGPGRAQAAVTAAPRNLRFVEVAAPADNCGFTKIGLRRIDPGTWQVFVSARNYGNRPRAVPLAVQYGGAPIGARTLELKPGEEQESAFPLRTRAAGWIEARLLSNDAYPEDDRVTLEVPNQPAISVAVYSNEPGLLRPLFESNPNVRATYRLPAAYDPQAKADVVVLDRFAPTAAPTVPSIWIEPPAAASPVPVRATRAGVKLEWSAAHPLAAGLRARDVTLARTLVFGAGDAVASVDAGAAIVSRESPRQVIFGFHPAQSAMKFELSTPLIFANILRSFRPAVFAQWELNAGTVGAIEAPTAAPAADLRVIADDGSPVPFTVDGGHVRFFAGVPGQYRVRMPGREIVYSLTLPALGAERWTPAAGVARGVPAASSGPRVIELWPWLALAGALVFLAEWVLYGRGRREAWARSRTTASRSRVLERKAS